MSGSRNTRNTKDTRSCGVECTTSWDTPALSSQPSPSLHIPAGRSIPHGGAKACIQAARHTRGRPEGSRYPEPSVISARRVANSTTWAMKRRRRRWRRARLRGRIVISRHPRASPGRPSTRSQARQRCAAGVDEETNPCWQLLAAGLPITEAAVASVRRDGRMQC